MSHPPTFVGPSIDVALWKAAQELGRSPADLEYRSEELPDGSYQVEILGVPEQAGPAPEPPPAEEPVAAAAVAEASEPPALPPLPETDDPEVMARAFLEELGRLGDFPVEVEISRRGSQLVLEFDQEGRDELLLGGGQLLDAFQYLLNRVVQKHVDPATTVFADVGDEARKRDSRVAAMAQELADRVVKIGHPVHVEAALSPDRRTIHTALAGRRDVRTDSDGAGAFRKLVISPRPERPERDGG